MQVSTATLNHCLRSLVFWTYMTYSNIRFYSLCTTMKTMFCPIHFAICSSIIMTSISPYRLGRVTNSMLIRLKPTWSVDFHCTVFQTFGTYLRLIRTSPLISQLLRHTSNNIFYIRMHVMLSV